MSIQEKINQVDEEIKLLDELIHKFPEFMQLIGITPKIQEEYYGYKEEK